MTARRRVRVLDTRKLITTPPPTIHWLVDGIFARGKFTLIGGREKSGKSLVQQALGTTMASGGGVVAGIAVAPGRVLILDGENGEDELHRRVHSLGLARADADDLILAELHGFDLTKHLYDVENLIVEHEPDLVLLDSFRVLWHGSERDEEEIANALYPLADLAHSSGVAIGLTHHATKGNEDDYRGSTAIGAVPDWICVLGRDREDPHKLTRRRLTTPYARFAPARDDRWLQIRSEGDDGPVWLEACGGYVPEHEHPVRDEVEGALRSIVAEGVRGEVSPIGDHTPSPCSWSNADFARAVDRDPRDWTVREVVKRLASEGVIYRDDEDGRWHPLADALKNPWPRRNGDGDGG